MIMDLVVILILAVTIFLTMRKGFALSVAGFFRGFISLVLAWVFCDDVAELLSAKTELHALIQSRISSAISDKLSQTDIYNMLPQVIKHNASISVISDEISKLSNAILTIIAFFIILLLVRIIISLMCLFFPKKKRSGFTGFTDGLLGLVFGTFLGIINIFVFFALLFALISFILPQHIEFFDTMFENSFIALDLYNNNFLLKLLYDFLI